MSRSQEEKAAVFRALHGGSLAWSAVEALAATAERIRDEGDFSRPDRIRAWIAG